MIETDTTYLRQTPNSVDGQELRASGPGSSTNNIPTDTGASLPGWAFIVSGNTPQPQISA